MDFEWDERKRKSNIIKHGVDFQYAALIFDGAYLTRIDDSEEYDEERWVSLGMVDGAVYVVIHVDRGETTRIISAWKGGKNERESYYTRFLGGSSGS